MIAYTSIDSKLFNKKNIFFLLTNRNGGISKPPFNSLNLGLNTPDFNVEQNRQILKDKLQTNNIYYLNQEHGNKILTLTKNNKKEFLGNGDGIICNDKNLYAMVSIADCNPIILFSQKKTIFAILHAGRAGLEKNIITNAAKLINSDDIIAFVGASIRKCCYEIDGLLLENYKKNYQNFLINKNGKFYLDMILMIKNEFNQNNITQYEIIDKCTCCDNNFFSYRRDRECGRFALICAIK